MCVYIYMYNQELISSWYNLWHNIGSSRLKHVYWFRTVRSSFFIVWILYACSIRSSLSIGVDQIFCEHYSDVIMGTIASQITSFTIVYSTVYSDADQRKHQSSASLAFVRGWTGEFPAQMASNAENDDVVMVWIRACWLLYHIQNYSINHRAAIRYVQTYLTAITFRDRISIKSFMN